MSKNKKADTTVSLTLAGKLFIGSLSRLPFFLPFFKRD